MNDIEGWIRLHRKLLEDEVFQQEKLLKVFVWCLLKASHKEHKQLVGLVQVPLKKGQFVTGRIKAATELDMPESTAWRLMKLLEKLKIISIKSNNKFSVVTLEKYEVYQSEDKKVNNKRTANEQQMDTNKNGKNEKNKTYGQMEEHLWNLYPNKKGKDKAMKSIQNLIKEHGYEVMEKCVERYAEEVKGRDKKYIKHGSTFFNTGYIDYMGDDAECETLKYYYIEDPDTGEKIRKKVGE